MRSVTYIEPSDDRTGVADTSMFAMAANDPSIKTIVLSGQYWINRSWSVANKAIIGTPNTIVHWAGSVTSDYMLKLSGGFNVGYIEHVAFYAYNRSRGVLLYYLPYRKILNSVMVRQTRQVGIDLVDCWGANGESIQVISCRGVGVRMHRCNSSAWTGFRVLGHALWHKTVERNEELWDYACDNGLDAARQQYGDDLQEDWPDPLDSTIVDRSGNLVRTAEDNRGIFLCGSSANSPIRQGLLELHNVVFEPVMSACYPTLVINSHNIELTTLRWEGGRHNDSLIVIPKRDSDTYDGAQVSIRNVSIYSLKNAKQLLRVVGSSRNVQLDNLFIKNHLSDSIMVLDGGSHVSPSVQHVYTNPNTGVPADRFITCVNGAVIS